MWWQPLFFPYFLLWRSPRLCSRPTTLRHVHHISQYSYLFSFPRPPPLGRWYWCNANNAKVKAISTFKVIQGYRYLYQSKTHIRLVIKTIARPVLRIKSGIYQSPRNLYRGRRAVSLQTFTTRHSNRKLSIVMDLSTTFTQYAPEISKFL